MSSPRPDLLRLLAQKIFGEQARLFPWEEQRRPELPPSNRPATLSPAQRERPSDLRDMDMGELGRFIAEQEEAQRAGAAEAIHSMPASPVAGLVAALSPDTYANMAETEGPGGEAPTMAAALTGLETTGGPGHPLTPRVGMPNAPGGRVRSSKITGDPLPDPALKGKPLDFLKNEHEARWWDKFEKAIEAGPVALEKARTAAKQDWDARFKQWQISNAPPQASVVDQDFVIPSEGSARGVEPTMFQPAKATRPAKPAGAAPKPEKPKFIDPSAVSVVAEPMPEAAPPPPGSVTVEAIEGKPGTWRIRDPKSGLEQEFAGDRETADKHAKWLAQLSLRNEAREKLKAAKAAEKPKPAEPPKEPELTDTEAAKLIEARNQPEPGFEQDPTPERVAAAMNAPATPQSEAPPAPTAPQSRPDLAPNAPGRDAAEALVRRTAELQKKQVEGTATPEEIAEINTNIETNRAANAARMAPPPEPPAERPRFAVGDEAWVNGNKTTILEVLPDGSYRIDAINPAGKPSRQLGTNLETRDERMLGRTAADKGRAGAPPMTTGGGSLAPQGLQESGTDSWARRVSKQHGVAYESKPGVMRGEGWIARRVTGEPGSSAWELEFTGRGIASGDMPDSIDSVLYRVKQEFGTGTVESGRPATRGQKKPKYSVDKPVVGRRSSKPDKPSKPAAKLTLPEPPPGPPGETALNQTLGLKYTPPKDGGIRTEKDYAGRPHTIEPWTGIEPSQKKQMLKNKDLFDRILAGMPVKDSEFPRHLRGARKGDGPLEGSSVQEYLAALGKDVEDVNPASINWNQYNARQNSEPGSRVGLKPKPESAPAPAPEPPAEPVNENVPNKAGTISGKKAPGQTGKKFSKPAAPSKHKPLLYAKEDRDKATKFEHFRVNAGDDINTEYNVPQGRWVVIGTNAAGETVYIDQFATGPQARDLAESHTANIGKRKK